MLQVVPERNIDLRFKMASQGRLQDVKTTQGLNMLHDSSGLCFFLFFCFSCLFCSHCLHLILSLRKCVKRRKFNFCPKTVQLGTVLI